MTKSVEFNFVERCRKDAGWPELHRDAPVKKQGQKVWSITQDAVAAFVGQVRQRANDLFTTIDSLRAELDKARDEKAELQKQLSLANARLLKYEIDENLGKVGTALGLNDDSIKRLQDNALAK